LDPATSDLIPQAEVDDVATARAVVLASDALGVAPPMQIDPWLRSGELGVLSYQAPCLKLGYGFVYLKGRLLSPAAERFMEIVREIEPELATRNRKLMDTIVLTSTGAEE